MHDKLHNKRPRGDKPIDDGHAIPNRGNTTGVTDRYGGNMNTGLKGRPTSIADATGSDGKIEGGLSKNKR